MESIWIAVIIAASGFVGALVAQIFNVIIKKIDYSRDRFGKFLDYRIEAHNNIIKPVHTSKDHLNDFREEIKNPSKKRFYFLQQGEPVFKSDLDKINKAIQNNPVWPDIEFLNKIGDYNSFLSQIDEALENHKDITVPADEAYKAFEAVIGVCRKSTGVNFLNRKMKPLVSRKLKKL